MPLARWTALALILASACAGPPPEPEPELAGDRAARGAELFRSHGCIACHGPRGHGDGLLAGSLDPKPRDLSDPSSYRQGRTAEEISRSIGMGVLGATVSPMPSYPHLSRADKDALAAWVVTLQAATARSLRASGGWVRAAPPSARVTAAYLTLENDGDRERVLVGAAAEGFEAAEIHESVERQGSASMRPVEGLAIPAGEARVLAPGGVHVMLMGGRSPLAEGAELELALRFADGEELVVKLPVRAREPGS